MNTIATSRHEAKYLASHALLSAGFTSEQVGRAMLALEAIDPEPDTELEIEAYEPSEADFQEYEDYLERLQYEQAANAWIIQPVR